MKEKISEMVRQAPLRMLAVSGLTGFLVSSAFEGHIVLTLMAMVALMVVIYHMHPIIGKVLQKGGDDK